jgi:hypothetical protein
MKSSDSRAARVEREDMVMFINACFACTGQHEFYNDARGQSVTIEFLHQYILGNYRRLYARVLAAGINHFNKAQIILQLLASGAETPLAQRQEEGALIFAALCSLPPQRAYRVLEALRERRINNRRARAITKRYLGERKDLVFEALKYRSKLRAAAAHAHVKLPGELGAFLFQGALPRPFATPLFEQFRRAHYSKDAVYGLPYSIAEGFAAKHKIPRDEFLAGIEAQMTNEERLRLQRTAKQEEVALELDLGRIGLTRLAIYLCSLPVAERQARRAELTSALQQAARRALRRAPQQLGRVAAILDRSYSSSGSMEKRRRPLAVAWGASQLLRLAARELRVWWTPALTSPSLPGTDPDSSDELALIAEGQTDLAGPLLEALEWGAELILIVSDGYENDPPHGAAEVARVFRRRLDPQHRVSIIHLNPVFDAEHYAPRTIGAAIPTVGLRDAEDLLTMLGFARFADGSAPLSELEAYLAERVKHLLRAPAPSEAGAMASLAAASFAGGAP